MRTSDGKSIGEVPQKKDPYWWMHPAYRGEQALDIASLVATSKEAYRWTNFGTGDNTEDASKPMEQTQGRFVEFAELLFKINGFRAGAVANWYVVVCVEADKRWAVGQLRADPVTPVQLFEDLTFSSEQEARAKAESLRSI